MDFEMKRINITLLVSWLSIIAILITTYLFEVFMGERSLAYLGVFSLIMIIPWIISWLLYCKKKDWDKLGYVIVVGYSVMYLFVMFTGATQMVYTYILPLLCFLILYHRPALILFTFGISMVMNIVALVYQHSLSAIATSDIKEVEIRFASLIICFAGAFVSAHLYDKIHKERETGVLAAIKAEAANEAKGEFLAHMSHEIRTPINAVIGMDTMILRESKEPNIRSYAADIDRASRSLLSIINDILDFSKIESGKMNLVITDYDFSSLVNDTVNLIQDKAGKKGLILSVDVDADIPCGLRGDDARIRQILVNLLSNAVKYTEEGEVSLSIKGVKEGKVEKLHFSVKDTGIGIKEEDLHKLFTEFERLDEVRNRHVEGTGLGVAITLNLLKMMGSNLEVRSVYGEGSEFFFDLEQEIVKEEAVGNIAARIAASALDYDYRVPFIAPTAKVLVVDDNQTNLVVFENLLKETKIKVDTATSGKETLEKVVDHKYDMIFLDHMMPDMDGIEVMKRITSSTEHANVGTPVIALTANAIVGAKEQYLEAGFTDYLSKPVIPEKLEKFITEYLPMSKIEYNPKEAEKKEVVITYTEKLPPVEGIDWEYARIHLGNSEAILNTVSTVYNTITMDVEELEGYYNRIKADQLDEEAVNLYRIKIHSLKSTAMLIGIIPIAGMANTLEYAARDGLIDKILEITPYFIKDYSGYKDKLKELVKENQAEEKLPIEDKEEVIGHINELMEAINEFDIVRTDLALENIMAYQYNKEIEGILDYLAGAVSNLDTEKINEYCNELTEKISSL